MFLKSFEDRIKRPLLSKEIRAIQAQVIDNVNLIQEKSSAICLDKVEGDEEKIQFLSDIITLAKETIELLEEDKLLSENIPEALENPFKGKMFLIKVENSLQSMKGIHEISILGMKEVKDQTSTPGK